MMILLTILVKVLLALLVLVIGFVVLILGADLLSYLHYVKRYKKQGLKLFYFPITGLGHYIKKQKNSEKDTFINVNTFFKDTKEPIILETNLLKTQLQVNLTDPNLIKEFFIKEGEVSKRFNFGGKLLIADSLAFHKGPRALHLRSVLFEIFHSKNMKKLAPMITENVMLTINNIKKRTNKKKFTDIVLNSEIKSLFSRIVCMILFGEINKSLEEIPDMTEQAMNSFIQSMFHPLSILTFGWATNQRLTKASKESNQLENEIRRRLAQVCKQRSKTGYKLRRDNVVDLMIDFNQKAKKEERFDDVMSSDELISNIISVIFGGIDTSIHTTKASLHFMSENKTVREKIVKEIQKLSGDDNSLKFEECGSLIKFVNEVLRVRNPINFYITRVAVKNFKLGKFTIYKGDMINIPMASIHLREEFFKNSNEFDIERHSEEKVKKRSRNAFLPFGSGKRNCLGRYLALLVVKIIVGKFTENFEFEKVDGYQPEWVRRVTFGLKDCRINIKEI